MTTLLAERDPLISHSRACAALDLSRATVHRRTQPKAGACQASLAACLSASQRATVLAVLHSPGHVDQPPREVYGALLAEGRYLCSVRTMYRILASHGESRERRDQRPATHHPVPQLVATAPNQVWTWDITKLAALTSTCS